MVSDPRRQLIGKMARAKGARFEARLDATFDYYRRTGYAVVDKTPEPMKVIRSLGNGQFVACYVKRAQPDYKGTIKGGRTVIFEAKFTSADKMEQSRVLDTQADYMERQTALGARCYVVAGFSTGGVYRLPWEVWSRMKEHFGRKYITEADLDKYKVTTIWNDVLQLL